jgi:hypothetical protein
MDIYVRKILPCPNSDLFGHTFATVVCGCTGAFCWLRGYVAYCFTAWFVIPALRGTITVSSKVELLLIRYIKKREKKKHKVISCSKAGP